MYLTGAQEIVFTEMVSVGWDYYDMEGDNLIMARTEIVNDGPTKYRDFVEVLPNGKRNDIDDR
jgi:hypothetical protein